MVELYGNLGLFRFELKIGLSTEMAIIFNIKLIMVALCKTKAIRVSGEKDRHITPRELTLHYAHWGDKSSLIEKIKDAGAGETHVTKISTGGL